MIDISIASSPCDIGVVPSLLDDISALGKNLSGDDRDSRLALLEKARSLVRALETPRETMLKHCGAQTASFFCLALGNDVGLFKQMAAGGGSPNKVESLAKALGFEVDLLRRILRHLAAMGYICQTGPDEYKPTNFTKAMALPVVADGYPLYAYAKIEPMAYFHKWLRMNGYRSPKELSNNPQTFGHRTEMPFFDWLQANPPYATQFNNHMGGYRLGRPSWMDPEVYPVQDNLISDFDHEGDNGKPVMLVDIGGSYGHDLAEFRCKYPNAPGRLILQDLPRVLDKITNLEGDIERMPHDFLTPQPIKGARAYYMHQILHDYPDDKCVEIVKQVKEAMIPGYSKLLLNEHVIPAMGANWEATYLDVYMMVLFSARERTEDDWRELLEKRCGLKICKFWDPGNGVEAIIECKLAQ
ncbi:S-adenosyl-L-methionine-dependent methyltransferase [Ilyonectria robusta]|uniref:S-adenosyl-L-methionine-dependent methyltransferase n=1 Tax=Ilyonectria robusta TaxID=1079257 RepID=UPI001E8CC9EA|nr:S-adenosyl-L-methionine-dependent methyltransferase [Ilyonectria robusta]KAH8661162.1 S-adenosyl-L-methionine-dependent methyltransferase [Ilyonectria robusta]